MGRLAQDLQNWSREASRGRNEDSWYQGVLCYFRKNFWPHGPERGLLCRPAVSRKADLSRQLPSKLLYRTCYFRVCGKSHGRACPGLKGLGWGPKNE